jgi:hypothetical protein
MERGNEGRENRKERWKDGMKEGKENRREGWKEGMNKQ